jgi:ribonuclease III family protein
MLFIKETQPPRVLDNISLRLLATLGDAVSNLFEKERIILQSSSPKKLHDLAKGRINAKAQCQFLEQLSGTLTEKELDLVRRARNLKTTRYRKIEQAIYRHATAFEVLIGYLYLCDPQRLKELLELLDTLKIDG